MSNQTGSSQKKRDPQSAIMVNILITLPICFLLVFLIDGFLLYPIPAPEGTFDLDNKHSTRFVLEESNTPYADAEIIDRDTVSPDVRIYLVNENGQLHLLDFRSHFITRRTALKRDIPIDPDETQHYKLGWVFNQADVEISQGRMKCDLLHGEYDFKLMTAVYFLIAALLTSIESFFYRKIAHIKWK